MKLFQQSGWLDATVNDPTGWPSNAAIGCTVVTQEEADRDVPKLLAAKAALKPAFAFLSMEPLLGPVDLTRLPWRFNGFDPAAPGALPFGSTTAFFGSEPNLFSPSFNQNSPTSVSQPSLLVKFVSRLCCHC